MRARRLLLLVTLVAGAAACTSPEATRMRGGGPGADVGNTGPVVELHAGSEPYYQTPCFELPGACGEPRAEAR